MWPVSLTGGRWSLNNLDISTISEGLSWARIIAVITSWIGAMSWVGCPVSPADGAPFASDTSLELNLSSDWSWCIVIVRDADAIPVSNWFARSDDGEFLETVVSLSCLWTKFEFKVSTMSRLEFRDDIDDGSGLISSNNDSLVVHSTLIS